MLAEDIKDIAYIEKECFKEPWSEKMIEEMYKNSYDFIEMAQECTKTIGYANIRILDPEAELMRLAVLKERRNEGTAQLLLNKILLICKCKGVSVVRLEVRRDNEPATALYKKFGFVQNGIRKDYYSHPTEDAILMEKILNN